MNKFTIKKITLKNFKLFGANPYTISFGNDQLVVFDGPNGYGKTSVFDAVELALTGTIKRLVAIENGQVPIDVVVAHRDSPDVEIRMELSGDKQITIVRRLKLAVPSRATRIDNFSQLWDLYRIDGKEELKISEGQLCDLLQNANLVRDYHLFHYVQQEETAHFLRSNKEHKRAAALAELFGDTKEAEASLEKLAAISKKISSIVKRLTKEKEDIESRYELSADKAALNLDVATSHKLLLPWLGDKKTVPAWDKEVIHDLTLEKKNKTLTEISYIKNLVTYRDVFLLERVYRRSAKEKQVIKTFILCNSFLDRIDELRSKAKDAQIATSLLKLLTIEQIDKIEENSDLLSILSKAGHEFVELFLSKIKEFTNARQRNLGNGQLYTELLKYRGEMEARIRKKGDEDKCPLCGAKYESPGSLLEAIIRRGSDFIALISDEGKNVLAQQSSLEEEFLKPLIARLLNFVEVLNAPSPDLITELDEAVRVKARLEKFQMWLLNENIEYKDICNEYTPEVLSESEWEKRYQILADRIRAKAPILSLEYTELDSDGNFERTFQEYFEHNPGYLKDLTLDSIEAKIGYINRHYLNSLADILGKHNRICKKIEQLEINNEITDKFRAAIQKQIRLYQKQLITDIEIPFYIYSGKILQTHQAGIGNGIFIKDPTNSDQLKNVRLVADWHSDHDIVNTMSSGQISAIVIALVLSLNKVYAKGFNTILIDDPVQTMDDINMISFTELLRNEFSDRQIILSTHEDDVSRYLLYKFLKHGHSVRKVNLMHRSEFVLQNDLSANSVIM